MGDHCDMCSDQLSCLCHRCEHGYSHDDVGELVELFARRRLSDDKTIFRDIDIASALLQSYHGEIGFGIGHNLLEFSKKAQGALKPFKEAE